MNFSLKPIGTKRPTVRAFQEEVEPESVSPISSSLSSKPIDYLHLRAETEKRKLQDDQVESVEMDERKERELLLKRREESISGYLSDKKSTSSSVDTKQAGLVILGDPNLQRGEAKHINRMKETAQVNETFKNLMRIKMADREKSKAEEEFGSRPEEVVTKAYLKKKEESLRLEQELLASETTKKDMTNLFRDMLDSGQYARTNLETTKQQVKPSLLDKISKPPAAEAVDTSIKKVMEKIVPESAKEVSRAVEQQAKLEAVRIIEQLDQIEEDRDQVRLSAKERYLARKKQRVLEDDLS